MESILLALAVGGLMAHSAAVHAMLLVIHSAAALWIGWKLLGNAAVALTDSGGIQEETTILGTWCLTIRENTERPVTLTSGTNALVGADTDRITSAYRKCRQTPLDTPPVLEKWDGHAAQRIAAIMADQGLGN